MWAAPLRFARGAEASPAASNGKAAGAWPLSAPTSAAPQALPASYRAVRGLPESPPAATHPVAAGRAPFVPHQARAAPARSALHFRHGATALPPAHG